MTLPHALARLRAWRPSLRSETLAFLASAWFALTANHAFWHAMLEGRAAATIPAWQFVPGLFLLLVGLQAILLLCLLTRWTAKPVLALLFVTIAPTIHFMDTYPVFMDPPMLRNILETDFREARDLWSWGMVPYLLAWGVLPLLLLWRVRVPGDPWRPAMLRRALAFLLAIGATVGGLALTAQAVVPHLREHKEVRYLVTPGNYLYSLLRIGAGASKAAAGPRTAVGTDAQPGPSWAKGRKPVVLVIVVGETVRAANWGLNGYTRQTTPELAALDVIDFTHVSSCGTNTETSLPCMFSAWGRRDYDETRIRASESLLHVLAHAGLSVLWRDNQSGCKGVCADLPQDGEAQMRVAELCPEGQHCQDEVLLTGLAARIDATPGSLVVVLHGMGNHGPAYFQRYTEVFRRWTPTCDTTDLAQCSQEAIVNSYDNAVLYTDHVLAQAIALLAANRTHDAALVYLSDHGESLGEHNLYLHSLPYAVAPDTQTHVPMVMWLSPGFAAGAGVDNGCLRQRADAQLSHDNLFHTVLGLLDVQTQVYSPELDITAPCRPTP